VRVPFLISRLVADVELIHSRGDTSVDQTFQRVHDVLQARLVYCPFFARYRLQHVICRILCRRRPTNTDFQPHELRSSQCLDHGLEAVVSTVATGLLDPHPAWSEIKIVVNHDEIVSGELMFSEQAQKRRPASVHPIKRAGQFNSLRSKPSGTSLHGAAGRERNRPSSGGPLNGPHADVVTG